MTRGGGGTELSDSTLDHLRRVMDFPDLSGTRYELRHELDRGGMGVVYAARDRELERDVALKVLATAVADAEAAERLRREAQIIAGLEHPGIVPVHDVGALPDGRVFYAMKLVGGQRLDVFVRAGPPLAERLRVFLRVCEPVAFAHAHGVIHRDLKPENVMVGPFGEVLVMDWGVAKRLTETKAGDERLASTPERTASAAPTSTGPVSHGTAHGTILGTPAWMAPEQARGEVDRLDARADVYALGAILYFLLTGRAPRGEDVAEAATTRVPRPLEAICAKALAADPGGRYANAAELAGDVALFLEGAAVSAFPEGPWRKALRFASRHRAPLMLVAAYIIMRVFMLLFFRV
jgi:serine/threonine protein kinase